MVLDLRAVRGGDVGRLTKIPGVGKKTAERIGLELRDRLPAELESAQGEGDTGATAIRDDVMSALLNLGYHRPLTERAVDRVLQTTSGTEEFESILRLVLKVLAKLKEPCPQTELSVRHGRKMKFTTRLVYDRRL